MRERVVGVESMERCVHRCQIGDGGVRQQPVLQLRFTQRAAHRHLLDLELIGSDDGRHLEHPLIHWDHLG